MHTPGPWQIDGDNCGGGLSIRAANGARILHSNEVATYAPGGPISGDEARANARMAAAAPELLEALRDLKALVRDGYHHDEMTRSLTQAQAAIDKATLVR